LQENYSERVVRRKSEVAGVCELLQTED